MFRFRKLAYSVAIIFCLSIFIRCGPATRKSGCTLILYAFDKEGQLLKEKMTVLETVKVLGMDVYEGELSGQNIILAESGVGMTNAAMTVQRLIDKYNPEKIIFTGIAGAIDTSVHIGDIVVCKRWITHDYVYYGAKGPQTMEIGAYSPKADSVVKMPYFEVDSVMYSQVARISGEKNSFGSVGGRTPRLIVGEVGVSGNSFIDSIDKRKWLNETFGALITDMESAAVAQVCEVNNEPFIIFRSASDLAGGSGSESAGGEMNEFWEVAAENSSTLVMKFLDDMDR